MTSRYHSLPNLSDLDLKLLRVFIAVAHHKGFTAAQDELGLSQSTISIQIRQLEERLNVRLCERGRKGFTLTEEGRMILDAAKNLFRAVDNFRGLVGSARGHLMGEVHFGMVDALSGCSNLGLDKAIGEFARLAPEVIIHVDISSPQELLQGLVEERYHLVLTPASRLHGSIEFLPVFKERQGLYCGRGHRLFGLPESEVSREALEECDYAGRSYMRDWTPPADVRFKSHAMASHMEGIALMILSGEMVGYLPTHFARSWVAESLMHILMEDSLSYSEQFYLARRKSERNRTALAFFECVSEHLHIDSESGFD